MTGVGSTAAVPASAAPAPAVRTRHWSDIAGSLAFAALAVWMVISAPQMSLALIPVFAYELAFAVAFLMRGQARSTLRGWRPRIAAYAGSFLIPAFLAFANRMRPGWVASAMSVAPHAGHALLALGAVLILAGTFLSGWGLWYLRASVSLVPAARGLVTTGPYAFARHPLYAAYLLSYTGLVLQHPTPALAIACILWLAFTLARIHYEESVLERVFPEYDAYRARVGAFAPRITSVI